jgi:hypothetical protein
MLPVPSISGTTGQPCCSAVPVPHPECGGAYGNIERPDSTLDSAQVRVNSGMVRPEIDEVMGI